MAREAPSATTRRTHTIGPYLAALVAVLVAILSFQARGWLKATSLLAVRRLSTLTDAKMTRAPVICISHGGGPMPVLNDPAHTDIVRSLSQRVPKLLGIGTDRAPRAIVLVTAHWSTDKPTISSGKRHSLLYDYGGFPPEAYKLRYDAPGSPEVAEDVRRALEAEGLEPELDPKRGWDHGVFIPMLLIHPKADIPIVQLSVLASESPALHHRMGRALAALRDRNIAIVGSGFASYHNLSKMFPLMRSGGPTSAEGKRLAGLTREWSAALGNALEAEDGEQRGKALEGWRQLPHAYEVHPPHGGEHFMPLLVCAGAGGDGKVGKYKDDFLGLDIWTYYWTDGEAVA